MSKKDSFLVNRLKSVGIAAKGALLLIKNESLCFYEFYIETVFSVLLKETFNLKLYNIVLSEVV